MVVPDGGDRNAFYAMPQLDTANAFVVGDGNIFHTSNGGESWERQTPPTGYEQASFWGVHFHDPMNGIVGAPVNPVTTTDGGAHWVAGPLIGLGDQNVHCYGTGRFALFSETTKKIYHTSDNWKTIDSTPPISDTSIHFPSFRNFNWGAGDTMIAYGWENVGGHSGGLIARTSDGGKSWKKSEVPSGAAIGVMSKISDDTLFAGRSDFARNSILLSTDQGLSWSADSMIIHTSGQEYVQDVISGIVRLPSRELLLGTQVIPGLMGYILVGTLGVASVNIGHAEEFENSGVFPNPATRLLHVHATTGSSKVFDAVGRAYAVPNHDGTLDVSSLPAGVYYVSEGTQRARFVKE
jgi:hypothetical protein